MIGCQNYLAKHWIWWWGAEKIWLTEENCDVFSRKHVATSNWWPNGWWVPFPAKPFEINQVLDLQIKSLVWCSFWKLRRKILVSGEAHHGCKLNYYHMILIGTLKINDFVMQFLETASFWFAWSRIPKVDWVPIISLWSWLGSWKIFFVVSHIILICLVWDSKVDCYFLSV